MSKSSALIYLDKAVGRLKEFNLFSTQSDPVPVISLINKIQGVDSDKAILIARVLQQASFFNEVVRENIDSQTMSDRYAQITKSFDSIRDDAKTMVVQLEDGKLSLTEKASNYWMTVSRGTISDRFAKIKSLYENVAKDSLVQIEKETAILEAYKDFRVALKEAEILALEVLDMAKTKWDGSLSKVENCRQEISALSAEVSAADKSRKDLELDLAIRQAKEDEGVYQIAKDLADNLKVSYHTGEVVMARLEQTSNVKQRVYQQSVAFFSTNETVLSALNASFTSLAGLHESTQTLEAMKSGINKSLEDLGSLGNDIQLQGLKAGYGPTIAAQSVQKLVDSVIAFQEQSIQTVAEMRQLSTENAQSIEKAVREGQDKFAQLMNNYGKSV